MMPIVKVILSLLVAGATDDGDLYVRAARMLDVTSGRMVADPVVQVKGKQIVASAASGELRPPAGAQVIDLGELTLLPGLMDMHTHLCISLEGDFVHRDLHEGAADAALRGARHARLTLHAGFTTVRDLGAGDFADVALMRAIERGDVEGPWMFPVGHALSATGGHGDATGLRPGLLVGGPESGVADGADELQKAVRMQIKYGARWIKCMATAGVLSFEASAGAQQLSDAELLAIVAEARLHGIKVAAHAHGSEGIIAAVRAGVASIEHGSLINDEAIALMKQRGTYLVPTTYLADAIDLANLPPPLRAKAESMLPRAKENLRHAITQGVKIAFGTDAAVYPHGQNAREFAALVERGMTPLAAIQAATINAADLLGVTDRGVIAPGKLADLIAVGGDPLSDVKVLQDVKFVMHGGRVVVRP